MSIVPVSRHYPQQLCHRIDVIVYPGFKALEAIGPMSVFEYANLHLLRQGRPAGYQVEVAAMRCGPVRSDTQMVLEPSRCLDGDSLADTAIVVGARHIDHVLEDNAELVSWLKLAAPRLKRVVGLCSGSFFLAAAGVLDQRRATTHWSVADTLQHRYPKVTVEPDAIYVQEGRIWTSAGVTAGIDLTLALVEEDFGRRLALDVARELVVYLKRPGGQSQFSMHLHMDSTTDSGLREAQAWILQNLDQELGIHEIASRAAMSERNFRRVFLRDVGMSPTHFIAAAKLEAARRLLEDSALPLKSIAAKIGFATVQPLRKMFVKRLGVAPQAYRERFGMDGVSRTASSRDGEDDHPRTSR